jgi:hypothetical protein
MMMKKRLQSAASLSTFRHVLDQDYAEDKQPDEKPRDYYLRVAREVLHHFAPTLKERGVGKHMPKTKPQVLDALVKLVMFNVAPTDDSDLSCALGVEWRGDTIEFTSRRRAIVSSVSPTRNRSRVTRTTPSPAPIDSPPPHSAGEYMFGPDADEAAPDHFGAPYGDPAWEHVGEFAELAYGGHKIVEIPVERIVEKIVEIPMPVQKIVEVPMPVYHERIVEKAVPQPVARRYDTSDSDTEPQPHPVASHVSQVCFVELIGESTRQA